MQEHLGWPTAVVGPVAVPIIPVDTGFTCLHLTILRDVP